MTLPQRANLDWLRKEAKRRLKELRRADPKARLSDAQFALAKEHGFASWRELKAHIDALTLDGAAIEAAEKGQARKLAALLDEHPRLLQATKGPYGHTLLHRAAHEGTLSTVDLLLRRGLSPNVKEKGDDTTPMHWAAARGAADVVRRLAEAGGDVVGRGDDHALEVIGWATCWDGTDTKGHRDVVKVLLAHGATHHIYSAMSMGLEDEVRRIVRENPGALAQPRSRNEHFELPLQFAVHRNLAAMVTLLLELGADPRATDGIGCPASVYVSFPTVTRKTVDALARGGIHDLMLALIVGDLDAASRFWKGRASFDPRGADTGALHLLAKRGELAGVRWLLERGADPNARWNHWDAMVTPVHLVCWPPETKDRRTILELLLDAGGDPTLRDSMHDGDARGWAQHMGLKGLVKILEQHDSTSSSR